MSDAKATQITASDEPSGRPVRLASREPRVPAGLGHMLINEIEHGDGWPPEFRRPRLPPGRRRLNSATRLSDVISRQKLVNSRVYSEYFRPHRIEAELEIGIARSRVRTRDFILDRTHGDFTPRDRAVLEVLRPHLRRIHETTELRRAAGSRDRG